MWELGGLTGSMREQPNAMPKFICKTQILALGGADRNNYHILIIQVIEYLV